MYVLIDDDRAGLTLRCLRPWHRLLAGCQAWRLDRELADGASPESSAALAARAMRLTSMCFRRDLAASLRRIVAAAAEPAPLRSAPVRSAHVRSAPVRSAHVRSVPVGSVPVGSAHIQSAQVGAPKSPGAARPPRVPLRHAWIRQSAPLLAELASRLDTPGPVPVRGVAMVTRLLSEGTGPLYRGASRDDLNLIAERAARALTF